MARGSVNIGIKNYDPEIMGIIGQSTVISGDGNTITQTKPNGDTLVTTFNENGTITEVFTQNGIVTTKTTTFVSDTQITEVIS